MQTQASNSNELGAKGTQALTPHLLVFTRQEACTPGCNGIFRGAHRPRVALCQPGGFESGALNSLNIGVFDAPISAMNFTSSHLPEAVLTYNDVGAGVAHAPCAAPACLNSLQTLIC
jgi:hypothetical protein